MARRADRHGALGGDRGRQLDEPVTFHARLGGIASPMELADAIPIEDNLVARPEGSVFRTFYSAGEINAADMRPSLHQAPAGRQHQPILVVERRIFDRDRDIAGPQLYHRQGWDRARHLAV